MKYFALIFLIIATQQGIAQPSLPVDNFPSDTLLAVNVKEGKFQFIVNNIKGDSVRNAVKAFIFSDQDGKVVDGFVNTSSADGSTITFYYDGKLEGHVKINVMAGKEPQFFLDVNKKVVDLPKTEIKKFERSDYITTIKNFLNLDTTGVRSGTQFNPEEVLRISEEGKNVVYLFVDHKSIMAPGTAFPSCTSGDTYFRVIYLYPSNLDVDVSFTADALAVSEVNDLNIVGAQAKGGQTVLLVKVSERFGPYPTGVEIKVSVKAETDPGYKAESGKITIAQCNVYQVSIAGGFFASTLNNPSNVKDGVSSDGTPTLFADHARWQRALTIMAIFYPIPRKFGYDYKSLSFWQKWSVCFGTQLSENLFDDLLLGLNYEVSKGLGFSMGVHYGEHSVLSGYPKFRYGKDQFDSGTFSNTMMSNQWDFGLYAGVNLDLRVIAQLRNNGRAQKTANDNK